MPSIPPEPSFQQDTGDEDPLARLAQVAHIAEIDGLGCGEWTILYEYQTTAGGDLADGMDFWAGERRFRSGADAWVHLRYRGNRLCLPVFGVNC